MNFNYHIHSSDIKCPYCDKECEDDDYVVAQELETQIDFECEHCGKTFHAVSCIVFNSYSDCSLNGKKHDFECSKHHPTVFSCKNCYQTEVRTPPTSSTQSQTS